MINKAYIYSTWMFQKTFHEMMNCCSKCSKCIITLNSIPSHPCICTFFYFNSYNAERQSTKKWALSQYNRQKGLKMKLANCQFW